MKVSNGKIFVFFGIIHTLLGISPWAFGKQLAHFSESFFFKISEGLIEFPLLNGQMNYENFAAFWFVYFGLLLIPLGLLVLNIEQSNHPLPKSFVRCYLAIVLIGVYMIPLSGMTFLMLPHAIYMLYQNKQPKTQVI